MNCTKEKNYCVYVFSVHTGTETRYKIGMTGNIEDRYRQISDSQPFPLTYVGHLDCYSKKHAEIKERLTHTYFSKYRIHGEWFDGIPDIQKSMEFSPRNESPKLVSGYRDEPDSILVAQSLLVHLVLDQTVSRSEIRIWAYCLGKARWGGRLTMSQRIIASELGMGKSTVSTAIRKFIDMGYMRRDCDKDGKIIYILNADIALKGKRELSGTSKITERETTNGNPLTIHQGGRA